ncbi:MAG: ribonuclease H-like domain-containing protein [Candidatus Lokiarchaeota archaeon]|nr:ribonuclease H-like domain-containing protein [Candidatus Lokiarchaeota archaeon]
MDNYNFASFNISPLLEQYAGKNLEEIFENSQVMKNEMGEFIEIIWEEKDFPEDLGLLIAKKKIIQNLKTVHYIGEKVEKKLKRRGVQTLNDLKINLRYQNSANQILRLIRNKDHKTLKKNRYIDDLDLSFCFKIEDFLFLDIETLGLYDSPMIIVGLGYYNNNKFEIHIHFARDLEEEIAICEHLRNEILPNFKCFVTYNGKTFDIPYVANRFLYYFDENPMISENDEPYEINNTKYHHIDLYHNCRRRFKGKFNNYTLTNMEKNLLNWKRENELPSSLVGICYKRYQKNPSRYIGLIKEIIEHNYYDIYSMPLILKKLLYKE